MEDDHGNSLLGEVFEDDDFIFNVLDRDEGILLGGVSVERMTKKHARGNVLGFLNNKDDSCGDVEEFFYDGAIIDNFAPVNSQETWRS